MRRAMGILVVFVLISMAAAPVGAVDDLDPGGNRVEESVGSSTAESSESVQQVHTTYQSGDVFVAVADGKVQWRLPDGTLNMVLDTGEGGFTTGMAFDDRGHLFLTGFSTHKVYEFDDTGSLVGVFYTMDGITDCNPESIVFDAAGNMLVGQAGCNDDVLKIAPDGTLLDRFDVEVDVRGSDWIDLEPDQCTLRYTSEGTRVLRYDICEDVQFSDWGGGLTTSYALRVLPDAPFNPALLVASTQDIRLLSAGETVATYDADGENCWFALNLDPDAKTFWSADFCTSNVYQFDTATGDILNSLNSGTGPSTVFGLAVFAELGTGTVRNCRSEDLSGTYGEVLPDTGAGERVTVRYDSRFLVDESRDLFAAEARAIAEKIQERAERAVSVYEGYGFTLPNEILIQVKCQPKFLLFKVGADGFVGEPGVIQLRLERVQRELAAPAVAGFPAGGSWDDDGAAWKNLVDHEVFHTVQYEYESLQARFLAQELTLIESPAVLAQDLFPETDDLAPSGRVGNEYLDSVRDFAADKPTVDNGSYGNYRVSYDVPSVYQYWGERFGPQGQADLEQRVADFLKVLIGTNTAQPGAYAEATGTDALAALRDYYLAHYGLRASNISASENARYAIADAESGPAYRSLQIRDTLDISTGPVTAAVKVEAWAGDVYEVVNLPADATHVALKLDSRGLLGFLGPPFYSAIVPINPGDEFVIDPDLLLDGPTGLGTIRILIPAVGRDRVAIVFVNGSGVGRTYEVTAEAVSGTVGMQFVDPTGADPHVIRSASSNPILLQLVPTLNGEPVPGDLPRSAFDVTIGGSAAQVSNLSFRNGVYRLTVWAPSGLADGSHPMTVTFAATDFDVPGGLVIDPEAEPTTQLVRAGGFGDLGQGEVATAAAPVTPGTQAASFGLQWVGSDFDLTLTAPSGRIITEASTEPDVTVTQTASSVAIQVSDPEAGVWELQAFGSDVPAPEPVAYEVSETGAPLFGELSVDSPGEAGLALPVTFSWGEPSGGVVDGEVIVKTIDPLGVERVFQLRDDGASHDTGANDGVYAARVWATDLEGSYRIEVFAAGTTAGGAAIERHASTTVDLGPKVDTDGDGVADDAELLFGLDPSDASDGDTDHDGDGLGLVAELAAGTDPATWDTDGGGENDRSELDRALDPLDGSDDGSTETVRIGARPLDGSLVSVDLVTIGGTGSVQLFRVESDGSLTDLGLYPGSGAGLTDGPLADGDYRYLAVAVADSGAESGPYLTGTVTTAADVTPPDFRIALNGGRWNATTTEISVTFTDLTESVTEMRLATTEADLATAAWEPFSGFTTVTIPDQAGQQFVYAQVRDAAGNESRIASGFVFYQPPGANLCFGLQPTIVGTDGPDDIVGTRGPDIIAGLGGDDVITSSDGDDIVCGGDGADLLIGGKGDDRLSGQGGDDHLNGGGGADNLEGGDGADELIGGKNPDVLSGGQGDDTLNGGQGDDTLDGGPDFDNLNGGTGADTCTTGETVAACELP